jgi:hypothetical protein
LKKNILMAKILFKMKFYFKSINTSFEEKGI